ncbi:hint-domain-containing protein [Chytriomyces sp. MP71]|nr:hint-domain-containing protein [Chytriomyces sp. MP71]
MDPPPQYDANVVAPKATVSSSHAKIDGRDMVLLSVKPPATDTRAPVRIVAVVDLSGSMDDVVSVGNESDGLTTLDIVKHAVKTLISALGDGDTLAIVSFSDEAKREMEMSVLQHGDDDSGKRRALEVVDAMRTSGSTNIWAGLDEALDVVARSQAGSNLAAISAIFLFTDGQPNIRPPQGELTMLQKRKTKRFGGELPCIVNTFGFGTNLDSELLSSLAKCGNGSFAFIPDAAFVGTVFVDAACTILASALKSVTLKVTTCSGAQILLHNDSTLLLGGYSTGLDAPSDTTGATPAPLATSDTVTISIGSVQALQSKDIILPIKSFPATLGVEYLRYELSYAPVGRRVGDGGLQTTGWIGVSARGGGDESIECVVGQWMRVQTVQKIMDAYELAVRENFENAEEVVKGLIAEMRKVFVKLAPGEEKKRLKELMVDVEGQVVQAVTKQYFNTWGKHYLLSLRSAHLLQQCNNFKDPGVQVYQSPLFEDLREDINEIFLKLPPPKPTPRRSYFGAAPSSASISTSSPSTINMSRYYDPNGVCFAGENLITLASGARIPVHSLTRGTAIQTLNGGSVVVHTLVKTPLSGLRAHTRLVFLRESGLIITPFHPILVEGRWIFPCDAPDAIPYENDGQVSAVYSVLLEDGAGSLLVNGVVCAALGHELGDDIGDGIVGHAYFGCREKVLKDIERGIGFEEGIVLCEGVVRQRLEGGGSLVDGMVIV